MMKRCARPWSTPHIVISALKVALFAGAVQNVINQGSTVVGGLDVDRWRLGMNYVEPLSVSSYSAMPSHQVPRLRSS